MVCSEPVRAADHVDGGDDAGASGAADGAPERGVPGAAWGGRREADPAARPAGHRRLHRAARLHRQQPHAQLQTHPWRVQQVPRSVNSTYRSSV